MSEITSNAREASLARVQTHESILASLTNEQPAAVVEDPKEGEQKQEEKQGKKTAQERISELANKRREAENRAEEATKRAAELEARIRALETATVQTESSNKPARSQFQNDEQYIEALTDWKANEAIVKREQQQAQARIQAEMEEINNSYEKSLKAAQAKYDDFVDVVSAATTNIPNFLVTAIKESPIGADLTYYLALHKDEAEKVASMRPSLAIKYLARLEDELMFEDAVTEKTESKSAPVVKKPPAPIAPLSGNAIISPNQPKTFDEYKAKRLAAKRNR